MNISRFKKCISLVCMLVIASAASAQDKKVWSLAECVDYAMTNNINIKNNMINVDMAELGVSQSKSDYLPSFNVGSSYTMYTGRALDPTTYEYQNQTVNSVNGQATVSTSLFKGFMNYHNLKKSQIDLLAAREDVEKFKNDISLSIAMYYLEIIYNKELIVTLKKQIESSQSNIERMKKLLAAGKATKGELLDLEAQLASEEYSLVDGENQLNTSLLNLCQILELKDVVNFDVETIELGDLVNIFPRESADEIYDMAQEMPEIKAPQLRLESSLRSIKIAKSSLYPQLNFNVGYSSAFSDSRTLPITTEAGVEYAKYKFWDQIDDNKGSSLSLTLSIPIFNQFSVRNNIKRARMSSKQAEYSLRNAEIELYKDINQAHNDAVGALKSFDAALARVKANEESIKYSDSKFEQGSMTVTDYNIAKNNLIIAQAQMLQAKFDYVFKVQILNFYKGAPISEGL